MPIFSYKLPCLAIFLVLLMLPLFSNATQSPTPPPHQTEKESVPPAIQTSKDATPQPEPNTATTGVVAPPNQGSVVAPASVSASASANKSDKAINKRVRKSSPATSNKAATAMANTPVGKASATAFIPRNDGVATISGLDSIRVELIKRYAPEAYLAKKIHQTVGLFAVGDGPERAYIFTPQQPTPKGVPLILFHHGWLGMNPLYFGSLIDLIVRSGAVVVYPVYQDGKTTSPHEITQLAANANLAALRALRERYPDLIDESKTIYMGFSMGAGISLNLAIEPAHYQLPLPSALLLIAPGGYYTMSEPKGPGIYGKIEAIPANLPTILVSGLADNTIGAPTARKLAKRLCHLEKRNLILFPSDSDGNHHITAGHGSPGAPDHRYNFTNPRAPVAADATIGPRVGFEPSDSLNVLDYYGYWRLATSLVTFINGKPLPFDIFADNAENRFLGVWASGKEYAPAQIENPCTNQIHH